MYVSIYIRTAHQGLVLSAVVGVENKIYVGLVQDEQVRHISAYVSSRKSHLNTSHPIQPVQRCYDQSTPRIKSVIQKHTPSYPSILSEQRLSMSPNKFLWRNEEEVDTG